MKTICALGGGGSTFALRALERQNYRRGLMGFDPAKVKRSVEKYPFLLAPFHAGLRAVGLYSPKYRVLKRPDSFWTDWAYHASGTYDLDSAHFSDDLRGQHDYILSTRRVRSAGLPIRRGDLVLGSLPALVNAYVTRLGQIDSAISGEVILVAGHWGEYGILAELEIPTIYIIRDPFNSLISHSKSVRHGTDYARRGLTDLNSREWIDAYLSGPHHYWIDFCRAALRHKNATIVRYHSFANDWKKVEGLPDISEGFAYKENDVVKILSIDARRYIHERTDELCAALGFDEICAKYLPK